MNKVIILAGMAVATLGLIWFYRPQIVNNPVDQNFNQGMLTVEELNFNFGTVSMAAGRVSHVFKVKNISAQSVILKKLYTSCMCTIAFLILGEKKFGPYGMAGHGFIPSINKSISPGEEGLIEVVFDPAAHGPAGIGKIQRVVTIENNSGSPLELSFTATVTP